MIWFPWCSDIRTNLGCTQTFWCVFRLGWSLNRSIPSRWPLCTTPIQISGVDLLQCFQSWREKSSSQGKIAVKMRLVCSEMVLEQNVCRQSVSKWWRRQEQGEQRVKRPCRQRSTVVWTIKQPIFFLLFPHTYEKSCKPVWTIFFLMCQQKKSTFWTSWVQRMMV
jgi:hypothetical protein